MSWNVSAQPPMPLIATSAAWTDEAFVPQSYRISRSDCGCLCGALFPITDASSGERSASLMISGFDARVNGCFIRGGEEDPDRSYREFVPSVPIDGVHSIVVLGSPNIVLATFTLNRYAGIFCGGSPVAVISGYVLLRFTCDLDDVGPDIKPGINGGSFTILLAYVPNPISDSDVFWYVTGEELTWNKSENVDFDTGVVSILGDNGVSMSMQSEAYANCEYV